MTIVASITTIVASIVVEEAYVVVEEATAVVEEASVVVEEASLVVEEATAARCRTIQRIHDSRYNKLQTPGRSPDPKHNKYNITSKIRPEAHSFVLCCTFCV